MGSNTAVMNRNLLRVVRELSKSKARVSSYVCTILLLEYLNSLGFAGEDRVRNLTRRISREFFGRSHMSLEMAVKNLDQSFPDLQNFAACRDWGTFETVHRFDTSSTTYIA